MDGCYGLCLAFIVCIQAAFKLQVKGLLTWVRKDKQIYIHTYMHTLTFRKTISGNQARARPQPAYGWLWVHAWFKNQTNCFYHCCLCANIPHCAMMRTDESAFVIALLQPFSSKVTSAIWWSQLSWIGVLISWISHIGLVVVFHLQFEHQENSLGLQPSSFSFTLSLLFNTHSSWWKQG